MSTKLKPSTRDCVKDRAIINYHHDQNYDIYLETKLHNALISGHPGGGGVIPGSPRSFAQRRLQIPLTQNQDCLTKSY